MICRALGCKAEAMPGCPFCGLHDEMREDGISFPLKPILNPGPGRPKGSKDTKPRVTNSKLMATDPSFRRCTATTQYNVRCQKRARPNSDLCYHHLHWGVRLG